MTSPDIISLEHAMFLQSSFAGTSGASITAVTPTHSDSSAPWYTVNAGTWTLNGTGGVVAGSVTAVLIVDIPPPSSGNFDVVANITPSGSWHIGIQIFSNNAGQAYVIQVQSSGALSIVRTGTGGSTLFSSTSTAFGISGAFDIQVSQRIVSGTLTISCIINGVPFGVGTDNSPFTDSAVQNVVLQDYNGNTWNSLAVYNAYPVSASISGPSTCYVGQASSSYTVTLNDPAPVGGQAVYLASSVSGDTFQSAGANVLAITIPEGSTTGTFTLTASSTGSRTITLTSAGVAPATANVTASATPAATTYSISPVGAASGAAKYPSQFSVAVNGLYTGTITVTPSGVGLSTPVVLTFSNSAAAQTFTMLPTAGGTLALAGTNSGSLTDPSVTDYTVSSGTAYLTSVSGFPTGLIGGTTSGFGFEVSTNGGPYGSLQTSGIVEQTPGNYTAPFVAASGIQSVQWYSGSGQQAPDTSPQAVPATASGYYSS